MKIISIDEASEDKSSNEEALSAAVTRFLRSPTHIDESMTHTQSSNALKRYPRSRKVDPRSQKIAEVVDKSLAPWRRYNYTLCNYKCKHEHLLTTTRHAPVR